MIRSLETILLWGVLSVSLNAQSLVEKTAEEVITGEARVAREVRELSAGRSLGASAERVALSSVQPQAGPLGEPVQNAAATSALPSAAKALTAPETPAQLSPGGKKTDTSLQTTVSVRPGWRARFRQILQQRLLHREPKILTPQLPNNVTPEFLSTFQARPLESHNEEVVVSGTLFQTDDGEIYGAVVSHTLVHSNGGTGLGKKFIADVFDVNTQQYVSFQCKVVQVGAPGHIDAALVVFPPEAKSVLHPARLSKTGLAKDEVLHSQGFFDREIVAIDNRYVLSEDPFLLTTSLLRDRTSRRGLCGSALFNEQHEITGIHFGSSDSPFGPSHDAGYAVPARLLEQLVTAYRQGIEAPQARSVFTIDGHAVVELAVDEYVAEVALFDANENEILLENTPSKYPYNQIKQLIEKYEPRYMEFTILRVDWVSEGYMQGGFPSEGKPLPQVFRYDFQTKQREKIFTQNDPFLETLFDF